MWNTEIVKSETEKSMANEKQTNINTNLTKTKVTLSTLIG